MSASSGRASSQIVTGALYEEQLTALQPDREARSAFRDLVLRIATPGAALFDFGAGTGMDASFYAEHGFKVAAYDVDPQMSDFFADKCRGQIEAGRVTLHRGDYRHFLARETPGNEAGIDLITSNFAPLNLITDLRELFAKFHAITVPGGRVLASVLSPYYLGDMKYAWWWRNAPQLWRTGRFSVAGVQAPIVRRRLADFAAESTPYFDLTGVFRGLHALNGRSIEGLPVNAVSPFAALRVSTSRFMFLLFERRDTSAAQKDLVQE